jgi:hypothetical protein
MPSGRSSFRSRANSFPSATLWALAERFIDGRLSDETLSRLTDDEVEAALTEVPGIGPWTARGFLLVALDRPDVFLSGDLALRRTIQRAYGFDHNRVGIIGAGRLGQAMARTALRACRAVIIANSRGPGSLTSVVSAFGVGASAGTVAQASAVGIVVIAVPGPASRRPSRDSNGTVRSRLTRRTTGAPTT